MLTEEELPVGRLSDLLLDFMDRAVNRGSEGADSGLRTRSCCANRIPVSLYSRKDALSGMSHAVADSRVCRQFRAIRRGHVYDWARLLASIAFLRSDAIPFRLPRMMLYRRTAACFCRGLVEASAIFSASCSFSPLARRICARTSARRGRWLFTGVNQMLSHIAIVRLIA